MRKQYIDTYGGNAVMSDSSLMSNQGVSSDERQEAQENIANSGLTQNEVGGSQLQAMSNDLVESSESSAARQMIGNGKNNLCDIFNIVQHSTSVFPTSRHLQNSHQVIRFCVNDGMCSQY